VLAALLGLVGVAGAAGEPGQRPPRQPRTVIHYDGEGHVAREEIDSKGTGRFDLWVFYERGRMVRQGGGHDRRRPS
jgi:hypothetical protein